MYIKVTRESGAIELGRVGVWPLPEELRKNLGITGRDTVEAIPASEWFAIERQQLEEQGEESL